MISSSIINRREFFQSAAAGAGAVSVLGHQAFGKETSARKQPNIVFICTDQQHWEADGSVDRFFDTPAMNRLTSEGVAFDNAFCTTPQCSASRSSLLSGFYPSTTGVYNNVGAAGGNDLKHKTIGTMLQEAGYHVGFFGKWHLGSHPTGNAGWDERDTRLKDDGVTRKGIEFLKKHEDGDKPFALFLMYLNPHDIYYFQPGAKDLSGKKIPLSPAWHKETFKNKPSVQKKFMTHNQGTKIWGKPQSVWEEYHDYYREKVRMVDDELGQVLKTMDALQLNESTCTFFTSDHGDMDAQHKLIFKGPFMYEHMVRVPFVARIPRSLGGLQGKRVSDFDTVLTDVVPTLLDFAGESGPECHGVSLKSLLTGKKPPRNRDYVVSQYYGKQQWVNPIRMLRTHAFKYNHYIEHGEELYDLKNDPYEIVNLAGDTGYRQRKKELHAELDGWIKRHDDPFYTFRSNDKDLKNPSVPKLGTEQKRRRRKKKRKSRR